MLSLDGVKRIVRLDVDKQTKLYDFFVRNTNPDSTTTSAASTSRSTGSGHVTSKRTSSTMDVTDIDNATAAAADGDDTPRDGTSSSSQTGRTAGDDSIATAAGSSTKSGPGRKKKSPRL